MRPIPLRLDIGAVIAGLVLPVMLPLGAVAEPDTHSRAPIDITADRAEASNTDCVVVWRGAAEAVQEKTHLRADTITVRSHPKAKGAETASGSAPGQSACAGADRIEAEGHVFYMTPDQNARGDHAVYTQADDTIVITGDVVVVQGLDVGRGDRLTIKVGAKQYTLESSVTGAGRPGRVRAVYYPDKTKTSDAAAPAASAAKP